MLTIEIGTPEYGWGTLTFRSEDQTVEIDHTFMANDPIEDLIVMALDRLFPQADDDFERRPWEECRPIERIVLDGESHFHRFSFVKTEDSGDKEFVLAHYEESDERRGRVIMRGRIPEPDFARMIHDAVEHFLDHHSLRAYDEGWWGAPFPLGYFAKLRRALGLPPKTLVLD